MFSQATGKLGLGWGQDNPCPFILDERGAVRIPSGLLEIVNSLLKRPCRPYALSIGTAPDVHAVWPSVKHCVPGLLQAHLLAQSIYTQENKTKQNTAATC